MRHRLQKTVFQLLDRFLEWKDQHMDPGTFMVALAIVTGLVSGLAAVSLKNFAHRIKEFVVAERLEDVYQVFYFLFPLVGILAVVFLRRFLAWRVGEGIPMALESIAKYGGIIPRSRMYTSFVASGLTVGFGGSVGLEGPAVGTGSAIGSNLGRWFRLDFKQRILLISCATAGALASIFGTPIAAIVFTLEVFSLDLTLSALVPLLLASATGAITGLLVSDGASLFAVEGIGAFNPRFLPYYIGLGILTALTSVLIKRIHRFSAQAMQTWNRPWSKALGGGLGLGLLIYAVPPLYGEGFGAIQAALAGDVQALLGQSLLPWSEATPWAIIGLLFGLLVMKAFAAGLTLHAGGVGGLFAPSLFVGSVAGLAYVLFLKQLGIEVPVVHFVLVSMAGVMAGVMHAPLTAAFLITEVSGGYPLVLPLLIVAALSFFVARRWSPNSIYTEGLAETGGLWTSNRDQQILGLLTWSDIVDESIPWVEPSATLEEAEKAMVSGQKSLLAVTKDGRLVGIFTWGDLRRSQGAPKKPLTVAEVMTKQTAVLDVFKGLAFVVNAAEKSDLWYLPLAENGQWRGFVSKAKLFAAYRSKLKEISQDA
jgi:CIC family chloride channel protein